MSDLLKRYAEQVAGGLDIEHGADKLAHCALGLTGEAGEIADLVKKSQYRGGVLNRDRLHEELGDVLWYLTAIAHAHGWSLESLAYANIYKLENRRGSELYSVEKLLAP